MSNGAAPATVHSGIFVQSRLPILLHRVLPAGTLTLQMMGTVEAGVLGIVLGQMFFGMRGDIMSMAISGGIGAGVYKMLPA